MGVLPLKPDTWFDKGEINGIHIDIMKTLGTYASYKPNFVLDKSFNALTATVARSKLDVGAPTGIDIQR